MKKGIPLLALGICLATGVVEAGKGKGKPINFNNVVNPTFGDVLGGASGRNLILGTTGAISGADAGDYIQGAAAGSVLITGGFRAVDILATNLTANGGVTIANVTCNYNAAGDQDCDVGFTGPGPRAAGKILLIGVEINTTQVHNDNDTAAPTFDIVVTYN